MRGLLSRIIGSEDNNHGYRVKHGGIPSNELNENAFESSASRTITIAGCYTLKDRYLELLLDSFTEALTRNWENTLESWSRSSSCSIVTIGGYLFMEMNEANPKDNPLIPHGTCFAGLLSHDSFSSNASSNRVRCLLFLRCNKDVPGKRVIEICLDFYDGTVLRTVIFPPKNYIKAIGSDSIYDNNREFNEALDGVM